MTPGTLTPQDMARIHGAAFTHARAWSIAEFDRLIAQPGVLLACAGECFALGQVASDEGEILTVACAPAEQRQGRARAAIALLEEGFAAHAVQRVFLEVAVDNAPARGLYQSLGYRAHGRRPRYYKRAGAAPMDALIFVKSL